MKRTLDVGGCTNNEIFSISSAYELIMDVQENQSDNSWKTIWKL